MTQVNDKMTKQPRDRGNQVGLRSVLCPTTEPVIPREPRGTEAGKQTLLEALGIWDKEIAEN